MDRREQRAPEEQWAALASVTSLAEAQKIAGHRLETPVHFSRRMLDMLHQRAVTQLAISHPGDSEDLGIYQQTGLPGRRFYSGERAITVHGIIHPLAATYDTIDHYPLAASIQKWVKTAPKARPGMHVVTEQNLPAMFALPDYAATQMHELRTVSRLMGWSDTQKFFRDMRAQFSWKFGGIQQFQQQQTVDMLVRHRQLFRRTIEPLRTLCSEAIDPTYAIERSYLQYIEALDIAHSFDTNDVHLLVGLSHESHIAACFALYGGKYEKDAWAVTKPELIQKKAEILGYLAGKK